MTSIFKLENRK
jgi:hypothetical protein